jgi:formate hydrogenlyase transcriptional activator
MSALPLENMDDRFESLSLLSKRGSEQFDTLRAAFEESPHGVVVFGEDTTIRFVDAPAAAIFDYAPSDLVGQPVSRLLPGLATSPHVDRFWKNGGGPPASASRTMNGLRHGGGTVPLRVDLSLFDDGPTRYTVALVLDVSETLDPEGRLAASSREHVAFQRLVTDLAIRFATVDSEAVDDAIVGAIKQIGEALRLDVAALWCWQPGDGHASPRYGGPLDHVAPFPLASIPIVAAHLKNGECWHFSTLDDLPEPDRDAFRRQGLRSGAVVPLTTPESGELELSAVYLGSRASRAAFPPAVVELLRLIAGVMSQALARRASHGALQRALEANRQIRDAAGLETAELRREVKVLRTSRPVVSESAAIRHVLMQIEQVAPTTATVLLTGETGTGKEVMAQAVHDLSPRRQRPMIRVSCAAIPASLIESELFGREKGAFTGALSRQIGRFEAANQSTILLDEIGDLPMEVQVKLLRVLQERVIERLGSTQPVKVDIRVIAATNRNLEAAVRDKTFREDLFYRLNVFPIAIPPLRDRIEDIPGLVWNFVDELSKSFGKTIESISKDSMRELQRYSWPGNVRELRNVIERAVIVSTGRQLVVAAPQLGERPMPQMAMTLNDIEIDHIRRVLESTSWRVRGSGGAAERLGLKPTTLESRMSRLGIARRADV